MENKVNKFKNTFGDFTEEELKEVIKDSLSLAESIIKLNRSISGTSYRLIKKYIDIYNIDTSHFKNKIHQGSFRYRIEDIDKIFFNKSPFYTSTIKQLVLRFKLIEYKCSNCFLKNQWLGKLLVLRLDHINGNNKDHSLENLRFLCPNCDSQTETYCGKNKKKKEKIKVPSKKELGLLTERLTKINWPSTEEIVNQLKTKSYRQLGRELGVSDNSIRKRIKKHPLKII